MRVVSAAGHELILATYTTIERVGVVRAPVRIEQGWVSRAYAQRQRAPVAVMEIEDAAMSVSNVGVLRCVVSFRPSWPALLPPNDQTPPIEWQPAYGYYHESLVNLVLGIRGEVTLAHTMFTSLPAKASALNQIADYFNKATRDLILSQMSSPEI